MKTVHTIQLNNGTGTRTSTSRVYGACLVSTVTQQVVDLAEAELQALKAKVEELTPLVSVLRDELGMTVEEAEKVHDARTSPWFRAWQDVEDEMREQMRATRGRFANLSNADRERARKIAVERGHADPYTLPEYRLVEAAQKLNAAQKAIEGYRKPTVGDQCVLAWSRDAGLAMKIMSSYRVRASQGYTLTVRTDISTKTS